MQPITRVDVEDQLAAQPADHLRAILEVADLEPGDDETPRGLAARIARGLWWHFCTPLGFAVGRTDLADIVDHVASRLEVAGALPPGDAWTRLRHMVRLLHEQDGPVPAEDLDPELRARMMPHWKRTAALAGGATGSFGAMATGRGIVWLSRTAVGRVLPYIPRIGPIVGGIYRGGRLAAVLGGPVGVAMSLLAANQAMGTDYQRVVPLLIGIGALDPVAEAVEV